MKKIIALFFSMAVMVLYANNLTAQQKAKMEVVSVKQNGEKIRFTLTSSKPLLFGDNIYALYIGKKEFTMSETPPDENNTTITFLLNKDEFNSLQDGANIYLSYGRIHTEEYDMETYAQQVRRCWALGTFNKTMLTK